MRSNYWQRQVLVSPILPLLERVRRFRIQPTIDFAICILYTVDSRYLDLAYLE